MTMTAYEKWMDDMEAKGVRGLSLRQAFEAGERRGQREMLEKVRNKWDELSGASSPLEALTLLDNWFISKLAKELDDA